MCNNCIHKPVCSKFAATGGYVKTCGYHCIPYDKNMTLIDSKPIVKFIMDGLNNPDMRKAFGHDAIEILTEIEFAPEVYLKEE